MSLYVKVEDARRALQDLAQKLAPLHPEKGYILAEAEFALVMQVDPDVGNVQKFAREVVTDIFQVRAPAALPAPKE